LLIQKERGKWLNSLIVKGIFMSGIIKTYSWRKDNWKMDRFSIPSDCRQLEDILDNMKLAIKTGIRFVIKCLNEPGLGMG